MIHSQAIVRPDGVETFIWNDADPMRIVRYHVTMKTILKDLGMEKEK